MRCLRSSIYTAPAPSPLTTVAREGDARDTLDSIAVGIREQTAREGALVLTEMFDMPDDVNISDATVEGMRLMELRTTRELNQALLFYWAVAKWAPLRRSGTMLMDEPAPLTREEIVVVLEQLALHPAYEDFTVISTDETGALVTLAHGKIEED